MSVGTSTLDAEAGGGNHAMKKLFLVSLCCVLSACANPEFATSLQNVNDGVLKKTDKPACEIDPTRRPETLSVDEWVALALRSVLR